jgi:hypothetical protein
VVVVVMAVQRRESARLLLTYGRRGNSPSATLGLDAVDGSVCWILQVLLEGRHRDAAGGVRGGTAGGRCCSKSDGCSGLRVADGKVCAAGETVGIWVPWAGCRG